MEKYFMGLKNVHYIVYKKGLKCNIHKNYMYKNCTDLSFYTYIGNLSLHVHLIKGIA